MTGQLTGPVTPQLRGFPTVKEATVAMVLAAWLKESLIKRAEKRGREAAARECLEADGQRRGDETLAQAVERIRREKQTTS